MNIIVLAAIAILLLLAHGVAAHGNDRPGGDDDGDDNGSAQYDYIIVGGGAGGGVLANRLSADVRNSVLLIDLGPKSCPACDVNLGANTDSVYPYLANALPVTQNYLLLARKPGFPQYHGLGGNTKRFGGVHVRPSRQFLDNNYPAGYKYNDLLPHFLAVDDHFCHYLPQSVTNISAADCIAYHGRGGEMSVVPQVVEQLGPVMRDLVSYLGTTDVGNTTDYNDPRKKHGIGYEQRFGAMANKSDLYSARSRKDVQLAFLPESVQARRNLDILPFTRVTRINFARGRPGSRPHAVSVDYITNGTVLGSARARKHIFSSGGALETPKLLELSGVGSFATLSGIPGINLVANNTAVGAGMRAHHAAIMAYRTKTGIQHNASLSPYNAAQMFLNISATDRPADFQVELLNGFYVESVEADADGLPAEIVAKFLQGQTNGFPYIMPELEHNDVSSIGSTHIVSADPTLLPQFDFGWGFNLYATQDIPRFLQAIAKVRSIFTGNNAFAQTHIAEEIVPGNQYRDFYIKQGVTTEPLLTTLADTLFLQQRMTHFFHVTGTCSLGTCTNSDAEVQGVDGLSVCDASLLPANPDGNPTTTIVAVCDKVAKRRLEKDRS